MKTNPESHLAPLWTSSAERWSEPVMQMIETTRRLDDAQRVAVMPDVHLASGFCVGTVLATSHLLYPSAVGGDIGCGMLALPFHAKAKRITPHLARKLLDLLPKLVPARHQRQAPLTLRNNAPRLSDPALDRVLHTTGRKQLGTLGSGNHFLELQRDEENDQLWLMIHSGSRGLGQAISEHHTAQATGKSHSRAYLDANTPKGRAYLRDVHFARAYARLNRITMAQALAFALHELAGIDAHWSSVIHTDHNHVRRETLENKALFIHRKGTAPAFADQLTVIPGSMGTASYHVLGRGNADAIRSSSHGAGRQMDRATAKRTHSTHRFKQTMSNVYYNEQAASKLRDEAPWAYKDIDNILKQQREQVRVVRRLLPVLNYKGA